MTVSADIKKELENRILAGLSQEDASVSLMAVARQFLKDFPPEGTATGPESEGMLKKYAEKIVKLGLSDAPKS